MKKYSIQNILDKELTRQGIDPKAKRPGFQANWKTYERSHESIAVRERRHNRRVRDWLGGELKKARKKSRFTQQVVAKTLGLQQGDIAKIEAGSKAAEFAVIVKMAWIYDLPLKNIMPDLGPTDPEANWWEYTTVEFGPTEDPRLRAEWWRDKYTKDIQGRKKRKAKMKAAQKQKDGDGNPQP